MNRLQELYVGLSKERAGKAQFLPLIKIEKKDFDQFDIRHKFSDLPEYTHIIFTSKNAVEVFFQALQYFSYDTKCLLEKNMICIGEATAKSLATFGPYKCELPKIATQEGLIDLLELKDLSDSYIFLPASSKARSFLRNALRKRSVRMQVCDLYDTKTNFPQKKIDLSNFRKVIFSSPSTIDAFLEVFGKKPEGLSLESTGPITAQYLDKMIKEQKL